MVIKIWASSGDKKFKLEFDKLRMRFKVYWTKFILFFSRPLNIVIETNFSLFRWKKIKDFH